MSTDLSSFIVRAKKGTRLFSEGEEGNDMYFIHSGRVRIEKKIGDKMETLAVMEKGDFFGEMALIERTPRMAAAIIEEDSELLRVDMKNFEKLLQSNIEIAVRMIRKYATRLRETNVKYETVLKDRKLVDDEIEKILESVKKAPPPSSSHPIAHLVGGDSATVFDIVQETSIIGRQDPVTGILPDIDLTKIDTSRSVSRRHARLHFEKGKFYLTEEVGVRNGTFVNDEKLETGISKSLEEGVDLVFGNVTLRFELP